MPDSTKHLYRRAQLRIAHGDFAEARQDLLRLMKLVPTEKRLKLLWVEWGYRQKKWAFMEQWLRRYARCHKRAWKYWKWKGLREEAHKRTQQAIDAYNHALRFGMTPEMVLRRGHLQESLRQWNEAARGYRVALHSLGAYVIRQALIRVELRRGNKKAAIQLILAAMKKSSIKARWRLQLAEVLAKRQPQKATRLRKLALKEAEELVQLRASVLNRLLRARVWVQLNRREPAIHECRRLLLLSPLSDVKQFCKPLIAKVLR